MIDEKMKTEEKLIEKIIETEYNSPPEIRILVKLINLNIEEKEFYNLNLNIDKPTRLKILNLLRDFKNKNKSLLNRIKKYEGNKKIKLLNMRK